MLRIITKTLFAICILVIWAGYLLGYLDSTQTLIGFAGWILYSSSIAGICPGLDWDPKYSVKEIGVWLLVFWSSIIFVFYHFGFLSGVLVTIILMAGSVLVAALSLWLSNRLNPKNWARRRELKAELKERRSKNE